MSQTYFVKGLIGKVLAYGGLQIRTSLPHGLQPTNERRAESKLAYAMPSKEEEDKVKSLRTRNVGKSPNLCRKTLLKY